MYTRLTDVQIMSKYITKDFSEKIIPYIVFYCALKRQELKSSLSNMYLRHIIILRTMSTIIITTSAKNKRISL